MLIEVNLPRLSDTHDESLITFWHVSEGDAVEKGDTLVEVQTEKAVSEVEAPESGVVKEIRKKRGETAAVGDVLAVIETVGEAAASAGEQAKAAQAIPVEKKATPRVKKLAKELGVDWRLITPTGPNGKVTEEDVRNAAKQSESEKQPNRFVKAAPSVRKFAREHNVNLDEVTPTGPNGRILKSDVEAVIAKRKSAQTEAEKEAAAGKEPTKKEVITQNQRRIPLTGIRKAIANAMVHSKSVIPHVTHFDEANVTKLVSHRQRVKPFADEEGIKLTYLAYAVKALTAVLKKYPMLNASLDDEREEIVLKDEYHIGFAADTDRGLVVPVIKHADQKSLFQIAKEIQELAEKARDGSIKADEMTGSTCTISNIGSAVGSWFTPIIHHPESCILGIGRIEKKPVVVNDSIEIASMMALSLSYDHRLIDGVLAQKALNELKKYLSEPDLLFVI
ncbi:pyruvate dehydrogenase E2 component (dihydrolipoamide acetyltransferase) [Parageobacillus thermantarcticus]|uniref:Dihydrolipoamide acetyltransferase component of pyruvate dehydrogenase complex n=1 Tax=Parageobacillus thermantarcticus TaxID=186116 RepID=A0A1I0TMH2_9BACL|nr:dihydrolipoamide acetyltransferase family protein [Parageobacillus thermantarcticus]SFA52897.1 pyruvate dehydrogenase E2 component (dihydrolipoamide acetyltransferase) [Parageobacillus thermantarcticus]